MTARPREVIAAEVNEHLAKLGQLFAELEGRVPSGERLSPQQFKVATLAAAGLMNAEIGRRIGESENVVKAVLKHVFRVLGVRQRQEIAATLVGRGDS